MPGKPREMITMLSGTSPSASGLGDDTLGYARGAQQRHLYRLCRCDPRERLRAPMCVGSKTEAARAVFLVREACHQSRCWRLLLR